MVGGAIGELLPAAAAVALSPIPIRSRLFLSSTMRDLGAVGLRRAGMGRRAHDRERGRRGHRRRRERSGQRCCDRYSIWFIAGIGLLFLVMAARQWKKRPKRGEPVEMPGWMASISTVSPMRRSSPARHFPRGKSQEPPCSPAAAAAAIANAELGGADTALAILAFVAIGSITVVGTVAFHLLVPAKAAGPLAAVKKFMADNNATIMMVILVLLGAKVLGDALAGVWS